MNRIIISAIIRIYFYFIDENILKTDISSQFMMSPENRRKLFIDQKKLFLIRNYKIASKEVLEAYYQIFTCLNLDVHQQISLHNTKVFNQDHIHQLRVKSNSKSCQHIVLLHGYGGTCLNFIKMLEELRNDFEVHALDLYGIGLSSLGNYSESFSFEQVRDYYVQSIQQWRKASKIEQFILVGHSFGGYVAALYTHKYHSKVKNLILLSPAGTTLDVGIEMQKALLKQNKVLYGQKLYLSFAKRFFDFNARPSRILSNYFLGEYLKQHMVGNRFRLTGSLKQSYKKYLGGIGKLPHSSESSFFKMFDWPLLPKQSIEQIVRSLGSKVFVSFLYGDCDWSDKKGAERLQCQGFNNVLVDIIQNCGHQMTFDRPSQVCLRIKEICSTLQMRVQATEALLRQTEAE